MEKTNSGQTNHIVYRVDVLGVLTTGCGWRGILKDNCLSALPIKTDLDSSDSSQTYSNIL